MSFDYERWKEEQFSAPSVPVQRKAADTFPVGVYWAGMIWVGAGLAHFLLPFLLGQNPGLKDLKGVIIFSLAYLWCGWQTLTGSTASTIRPGIWSVFFGIVWGAVAVMDAQSKVNVPNGPLVFLFLAALSGSLLLAGFLAIKGSPSYKQWRRANRLYD